LLPDSDDPPWHWAMTWQDPAEVTTAERLPEGPRTVVVAGDGAGPAARDLALGAHWPLLAEPTSGSAGPDAVAAYRLLLELPELGGRVQRVVAFGRPTLSRPVTRLLSRPDVELVLADAAGTWHEPGRPARRVHAVEAPHREPDDWARCWSAASVAAAKALDAALDASPAGAPLGPVVAREVARGTVAPTRLVVAASNPVRDLDLVGHDLGGGVRVVANRGLAGIDGTVSTATGLALGGAPVRVLVGDLAFLHDLNGLLVPPTEVRPEVQVVVLDDGGGGIFGLLEHGERAGRGPGEAAAFERLFGTPHGADLAALCRGYGVPYLPAGDAAGVREALAGGGPGVVHVRTTRAGLRELHARLRAEVHAAVRAALA
jgi:2-succinyl-5-enolpyruvyl-6-hydroxy-3-cyclohexene-1-carboxylate synthase